MTIRALPKVALPLMTAFLLGGCGALLGGGKPAQLYRFGDLPAPRVADISSRPPTATGSLLLMPARFATEIEGDRILAIRDREAFFLKSQRWVAPASTLFTAAVRSAFRSRAPWITVSDSRAVQPADHVLEIRIDVFEARYEAGAKAAPTIHVEGEASLTDVKSHRLVGSYRLASEQAASVDTATAIVAAFDSAATASAIAAVDWAAGTAGRR